jgi:ferredoxin-type protein NapH
MANPVENLGDEAVAAKGWLRAHKWLLLRRSSQLAILLLFLLGPWAGIWIVKGNLASSLTLDILPLTDPYLLLQSLFAGHVMESTAVIGAVIVLLFYLLVGGRVYCSWVCPVNLVTDAADWVGRRFRFRRGARFSRKTRYWFLGMTLVLAAATGSLAWELLNPVSMVFRGLVFGPQYGTATPAEDPTLTMALDGLVFGMGLAWGIVLAVFLFDLFISRRGWCGYLCPVGAFYSLLGRFSLVRVSAVARSKCDDCLECFTVCPEPQVISPALKGADQGIGPVILSANCTNCGRCVDICAEDVFSYTTRFHQESKATAVKPEMRSV